jgi:hypothetical protein
MSRIKWQVWIAIQDKAVSRVFAVSCRVITGGG